MKFSFTVFFFLFFMAAELFSGTGNINHFNTHNNINDSADIINLENKWTEALTKKDEDAFRKFLPENFIYTENDKMYSRDEVLQSLMSPAETVDEASNEDMQVHLYGNTAIATGWLIVKGHGSDGKFNRKYRYTDIWIKNDNTWQIIAAQDYLMP